MNNIKLLSCLVLLVSIILPVCAVHADKSLAVDGIVGPKTKGGNNAQAVQSKHDKSHRLTRGTKTKTAATQAPKPLNKAGIQSDGELVQGGANQNTTSNLQAKPQSTKAINPPALDDRNYKDLKSDLPKKNADTNKQNKTEQSRQVTITQDL